MRTKTIIKRIGHEVSEFLKEMAKMRDLEAQLGRAQKAESDMREKMNRHRMEMESILENRRLKI